MGEAGSSVFTMENMAAVRRCEQENFSSSHLLSCLIILLLCCGSPQNKASKLKNTNQPLILQVETNIRENSHKYAEATWKSN